MTTQGELTLQIVDADESPLLASLTGGLRCVEFAVQRGTSTLSLAAERGSDSLRRGLEELNYARGLLWIIGTRETILGDAARRRWDRRSIEADTDVRLPSGVVRELAHWEGNSVRRVGVVDFAIEDLGVAVEATRTKLALVMLGISPSAIDMLIGVSTVVDQVGMIRVAAGEIRGEGMIARAFGAFDDRVAYVQAFCQREMATDLTRVLRLRS